jgi:hypothetical protein
MPGTQMVYGRLGAAQPLGESVCWDLSQQLEANVKAK